MSEIVVDMKSALSTIMLAVVSILCVSGCAPTKKHFPNFPETVVNNPRVNVILDAIVFSDIQGSDLGFNEAKNDEIVSDVKSELQRILRIRGFEPVFLTTMNGLFFEPDPKVNYVMSDDWESLNKPFINALDRKHDSPWYTKDIKLFFDDVISRNLITKRQPIDAVSRDLPSIPLVLKGFDKALVLYVRVKEISQTLGKKVGVGLLSGGISSALTGGALAYIASGPATEVHVVAMELKKRRVVWFNHLRQAEYRTVKQVTAAAFMAYPDVDGLYWSRSERRKKIERENKRQSS
ncbi:hypothetical protein NBRC116583_14860 [Arenicella sp. 4NH20-0111]